MSNSLWPHGLQHARPPHPSPTPRAYSNTCPSSRWCHPTISSSVVPFSSCLQSFPSIRVFSSESVLHIRGPKYWSFSFSISLSNEYSWLTAWGMHSVTDEPTSVPRVMTQPIHRVESADLLLWYRRRNHMQMGEGNSQNQSRKKKKKLAVNCLH